MENDTDANFDTIGPEGDPEEVLEITDALLAEDEDCDRRVDFEAGMSLLPVITCVLIAANVAVFGSELWSGALNLKKAVGA